MTASANQAPARHDPVQVICRHLRSADEVTRCAAARALGALGAASAASALVAALLDEDPDVRADAMAALVHCARPDDAATIRRSLAGDPVREVKIAAIDALSALGDREAIPLLTALVEGRCEGEVAWEDELEVWDDWLDVQVAAIDALAKLEAVSAIDALIRARADEMGQELDQVVFRALAKIGDGGMSALLGFVRDAEPRTRARAISAVERAAPERLRPLLGLLLGDDGPEVRMLAIRALDPREREAADLALHDPAPVVRRAALAAFAPARPDIARRALVDEDEEALAIALAALPTDIDDDRDGTLSANISAWMATGGPRLATAAVARLAALQGAAAVPALIAHGADPDRPPESRIAALQEIARLGGTAAVEALRLSMTDRTRQVRAAALLGLTEIARDAGGEAPPAALAALIDAMKGLTGDDSEAEATTAAAAAGAGARRIRTTPDGEIVFEEIATDAAPVATEGPSSTLEALDWGPGLTAAATPAGRLSGEPADDADALHGGDAAVRAPKAGGRRRVPVDGPDDIAEDLRVLALRLAASVPGQAVADALADATRTGDQAVRRAAMEGLAIQAAVAPLGEAVKQVLHTAIADRDPVICATAARAALAQDDEALRAAVAARTDDADATVRTLALRALGPGQHDRLTIAAASDPVRATRDVAMALLLESGDLPAFEEAVSGCLAHGHADTLSVVLGASPIAQAVLIDVLAAPDSDVTAIRTALDTFAAARRPGSANGPVATNPA